jgi:hypothetical protein
LTSVSMRLACSDAGGDSGEQAELLIAIMATVIAAEVLLNTNLSLWLALEGHRVVPLGSAR